MWPFKAEQRQVTYKNVDVGQRSVRFETKDRGYTLEFKGERSSYYIGNNQWKLKPKNVNDIIDAFIYDSDTFVKVNDTTYIHKDQILYIILGELKPHIIKVEEK